MNAAAHARISHQAVWETADKFLRNVVDEEDYGEYILPFLIARRLECLLDETKQQVLEYVSANPQHQGQMLDIAMNAQFGLTFYNTSQFTLATIAQTDDHVLESLCDYIDGFSANVADVWESLKFKEKAETLERNKRLWQMVRHFASLDLHPDALEDVQMGDLFEDIMYRAFTTKGKGAGNFYTPRDAIRVMVDILLSSDDLGLAGDAPIRSIYDPTAGTGGMLLVAQRELQELNPNIDVSLHGQEIMDWAYAIGKADLLIQGGRPDAIRQGNTLIDDRYEGDHFDYVLSNPPFGVDWSADYAAVKREAEVPGSRFSHGLPPKSDGAMLFLSHVVSKLTPAGPNGSGGRGAIVLNGSPLFTGAAESGPDSIRRWLLTSDLVDAIIALPTDMFYGTGIATYIWIVDTNKEPHRKGKIQLIDGTAQWQPMRKGMGNKRREISDEGRLTIVRTYQAFEETDISKIVTADDLGYKDVPVVRPARLGVSVTEEALATISEHKACTAGVLDIVRALDGSVWNELPDALKSAAKQAGEKMPVGLIDVIAKAVGVEDEDAPAAVDRKGKPVVVDGFSMTERIPLSEDVDEHMRREVLPFAPDAVWDEAAAKTGYEIPFTRLFYKPEPVRLLEAIDADVRRVMASLTEKFKAVQE